MMARRRPALDLPAIAILFPGGTDWGGQEFIQPFGGLKLEAQTRCVFAAFAWCASPGNDASARSLR